MDISEVFFTKFSNWKRTKNRNKKAQFVAFFEEEELSLRAFFAVFNPDQKIIFRKGQGIGSVGKNSVIIPSQIGFFDDKELNRKVLLHKSLVAGVIFKHKLSYYPEWQNKKDKSLQIWLLEKKIQSILRNEVLGYDDFFKNLFISIDQKRFPLNRDDRVFEQLTKNFDRSAGFSFNENIYNQMLPFYEKIKATHSKRVSYFPTGKLMLSCGLMTAVKSIQSQDYRESGKRAKKIETEIEGKNISESDIEVVDLDSKKKEENPIMHSFETLHTADEYQGGYRVSDGSDDLADHQNALDELNLESVTRGGDASSSVYRAVVDGFFEMVDGRKSQPKNVPSVLLPEWDYKLNELKKDHCRLYLAKNNSKMSVEQGHEWLKSTKNKYSFNIELWKKKIEHIVNNEHWVGKQWDGSELDLESYINFCGDQASGHASETPLYIKNKKNNLDMASLFLFDQSFSTDSWVQNRRVLDVELESIAITGLLTSLFLSNVAVGGTWSETRNHCYFSLYKDFSDGWSEFYRQAPKIQARGYTRLGPSIRYSIEKLCSVKSKRRLLIILTDGKPTDYDRYEGRYGIEDIRNAVQLAEKSGVYIRALTVEKGNPRHLSQIFGAGGYVILNDIEQLPETLWRIFLESTIR